MHTFSLLLLLFLISGIVLRARAIKFPYLNLAGEMSSVFFFVFHFCAVVLPGCLFSFLRAREMNTIHVRYTLSTITLFLKVILFKADDNVNSTFAYPTFGFTLVVR